MLWFHYSAQKNVSIFLKRNDFAKLKGGGVGGSDQLREGEGGGNLPNFVGQK